MDPIHILGYVGAVVTGLVLGLLGGGGALLSIPVLVYFFQIPASIATGYSLFLVGVTASGGAIQNIRNKMINYRVALYYGLPSTVTVYLVRRFLIPSLPDTILSLGSFTLDKNHLILFILVAVMLIAAYKMITAVHTPLVDEPSNKGTEIIKLVAYAVVIGSFLGLVGAGGGFLMIPALVLFAHLPMRKAVATSLLIVAANSFIGFIGDLQSSMVMDWTFLLVFAGFSLLGIFTGTYLHHYINGDKMKKPFGWFILAVAIMMIVRELWYSLS